MVIGDGSWKNDIVGKVRISVEVRTFFEDNVLESDNNVILSPQNTYNYVKDRGLTVAFH